jgi:hypothetical protein
MECNDSDEKKRQRSIEVNMSSEAIDRKLREVGELNQLGLSLARAKLCPLPTESTTAHRTQVSHNSILQTIEQTSIAHHP